MNKAELSEFWGSMQSRWRAFDPLGESVRDWSETFQGISLREALGALDAAHSKYPTFPPSRVDILSFLPRKSAARYDTPIDPDFAKAYIEQQLREGMVVCGEMISGRFTYRFRAKRDYFRKNATCILHGVPVDVYQD